MGNKVSNMNEDIELTIIDLGDLLLTKSHKEILEFLKNKQLQLGDWCKNGKDHPKTVTLYKAILSYATNGDKLITCILDECVERGGSDDINSHESFLRVSFTSLGSSKKPTRQSSQVIKDMIDFKSSATRALLTHPVIEAFLNYKWQKSKKFFMLNFIIYLLFLVTYSVFLANIFYRKIRPKTTVELSLENNRITFPTDLRDFQSFLASPDTEGQKRGEQPPLSAEATWSTYRFCNGRDDFRCTLEILMTFLISILALQEILQLLTLGPRRYLSEFENWLEFTLLTLSTLGLVYQKNLVIFKWLSAFGITLSYVEVIFFLGRYPNLGGSISLMFYTITKHLFKTLLSFFLVVTGFAYGFFIIHFQSGNDKFENFGKAFLKTLVMSIGEFDFDDLYSAHEDPYALGFTMALLVALIVMVTLVFINLLVALIVTNLDELRTSGHIQELVNKAQHIAHIESALNSLCYICRFHRSGDVFEVAICTHSQCHCKFEKMDSNNIDELLKIEKRKIFNLKNRLNASTKEE